VGKKYLWHRGGTVTHHVEGGQEITTIKKRRKEPVGKTAIAGAKSCLQEGKKKKFATQRRYQTVPTDYVLLKYIEKTNWRGRVKK